MEIHVTKHHQAYVTNLNAALVQYAEVKADIIVHVIRVCMAAWPVYHPPMVLPSFQAESKNDIAKMVQLQSAIKFNGGGGLLI